MKSLRERFEAKVDRMTTPGGCWTWTGAVASGGSGQIRREGPSKAVVSASHVSWELEHGPVPDGLVVFQDCENPRCVRVDHLRIRTRADSAAATAAQGRMTQGTDHWSHKLEPWMVVEIRRRYAKGETLMDLARCFGVASPSILDVVRRKSWKSVP